MKVKQFVMAYKVEQDRVRALLPTGFESLRPVLRINAEIRDKGENETVYLEFNAPVEYQGRRGWLNIARWESPATEFSYTESGSTTTFTSDFLSIAWTGVGLQGGCPAEKDNDGCFFIDNGNLSFRPNEFINSRKEFCSCSFQWKFNPGDACGKSTDSKSVPAFMTEQMHTYEKAALTAQNAAAIPCQQVLGAYKVEFERL